MRRWRRSWPRAYAKFTGELGVCIATSGPGASHLITGLYDARLDHMPVLAIAGQQARTALGGQYQQEVDLPACSRTSPARSCSRRARRRRCATSSTAPCGSPRRSAGHRADLPERPAGDAVRGAAAQARHACIPASATPTPTVVPCDADLQRAADVLNAGRRSRSWSARARCTRRTRSSRSPTGSAPASPRRCSARRRCPTICRG